MSPTCDINPSLDIQYILDLLYSPDNEPETRARPFDITRLPQTSVREVLAWPVATALAETIRSHHLFMGALWHGDHCLGTAILISKDLILCARHCVTAIRLNQIVMEFEYFDDSRGYIFSHFQCDRAMESSQELGYAILSLKGAPGLLYDYPDFSPQLPQINALALLHHPGGRSLKVSVQGASRCTMNPVLFTVSHDADTRSAGGAYINPNGKVVAMHLGLRPSFHNATIHQHAVTIHSIVAKKPDGIIAQLIDGRMPRQQCYGSQWVRFHWPLPFLARQQHR